MSEIQDKIDHNNFLKYQVKHWKNRLVDLGTFFFKF